MENRLIRTFQRGDASTLSRITGLKFPTIYAILNGQRNTTYKNATKIAEALNITLTDLQVMIFETRKNRVSSFERSQNMRPLPLLVLYTSAPQAISDGCRAA